MKDLSMTIVIILLLLISYFNTRIDVLYYEREQQFSTISDNTTVLYGENAVGRLGVSTFINYPKSIFFIVTDSVSKTVTFMQDQRFIFTLTDIESPETEITFGVWAKKWSQAKSRVYQYAIENGFDVSDDSRLDGKPSNKPADHEIEEEISVHSES